MSYLTMKFINFIKGRLIFNILLFLNVCKQNFHITLAHISQKLKGVLMWSLQQITFIFHILYFICISASLSTKQIHSRFFFQKNEYLGRYTGICVNLSCKKCVWGCKIPSKQNTDVCHRTTSTKVLLISFHLSYVFWI